MSTAIACLSFGNAGVTVAVVFVWPKLLRTTKRTTNDPRTRETRRRPGKLLRLFLRATLQRLTRGADERRDGLAAFRFVEVRGADERRDGLAAFRFVEVRQGC